jgi:hypothetical protein
MLHANCIFYMQHHTVVCGMCGCATLSHKRHDFRGKCVEQKRCFLNVLYNFCVKKLLFLEEFGDMLSLMYIRFHVKYAIFLSDLNETRVFAADVRKF